MARFAWFHAFSHCKRFVFVISLYVMACYTAKNTLVTSVGKEDGLVFAVGTIVLRRLV